MSLPDQAIQLPFVGGVDEKSDAVLSMRPSSLINVVERKTGALEKRYGFEQIADNTRIGGGVTVPDAEMLVASNDALIRVGGGDVEEYKLYGAGPTAWKYRGRCNDASVKLEPVASTGNAVGVFANADIAYDPVTNQSLHVYINYDGFSYKVVVNVTDESTGTRIHSEAQLESLATAIMNPRVVVIGGFAHFYWYDLANTRIRGANLNLVVLNFGAVVTVLSPVVQTTFDAKALGSTAILLAEQTIRGLNSAFATVLGPTACPTGGGITPVVAVHPVSGERVWTAVGQDTGGPGHNVVVRTFTTALVAETGPFTVASGASPLSPNAIGIVRLANATTAMVTWSRTDLNSYWNTVTTAGVLGTARAWTRSVFVSAPFVVTQPGGFDRVYALMCNRHGTHATHFLVDLWNGGIFPLTPGGKIAGVAAPRQLRALGNLVTPGPRRDMVSSVATLATGERVMVNCLTSTDPDTYRVVRFRWAFHGQGRRTAVTINSLTVLSGGVLNALDGDLVPELGFAHEPDVSYLNPFTNALGGALTANTTYSYRFVYAWSDGRGNIHRSAPSNIITGATTALNRTINGTAPPLHLTEKTIGGFFRPLYIEVYRNTVVGGVAGSTFYYVTRIINAKNAAPIAFTDANSDATISANAQLYTTGNVLDHVMPPSASLVAVYKGAPILAGTDDDAIWIGGTSVQGEGPWFNDELTIEPFEGGRVTALAALDNALIVFKSTSIYVITGDPPNDLGSSSMSAPQRLQTDVGCDDPNSIVATPDGVFFYSAQAGLCILDRSFAVQQVGRRIEASYTLPTSGRTFAAAALLPGQHLVRFLQYNATSRAALNYDYYHAGVYQGPYWTEDNYSLGVTRAACVWQGRFVWVDSAGLLWREKLPGSATAYVDNTATYVQANVTVAFEKAQGPQGFHRVRRIHALLERMTPHNLTIEMRSDVAIGGYSRSWTDPEIVAASVGTGTREQLSIHNDKQKVQWLSVRIQDAAPTGGAAIGTGQGPRLRDITAIVAPKTQKGPRLPAANRK